ncbi:G-patch domain and KOW motifs-containing protein [Lampetra planeri]
MSRAAGNMEPSEGDAGAKVAVSFGFSKKIDRSRVKEASVLHDEKPSAEETDFVTGVEGKEVVSVKSKEKVGELVIPLIQKNRYVGPALEKHNTTEGQENQGQKKDDVESKAIQELLEESRRFQELQNGGEKVDENLAIPLLMQNKVPEGYEDGDKVDVSLRPESATEADYAAVPIEAYGLAMLRGMGWKKGEGIGRTFKQDVKPIEAEVRPKGLGLGADRSAADALKDMKPQRPLKPGEKRPEEQPKGYAAGAFVVVEKGPHKDLYAKVDGLDPDNARLVLRLAIGGNVITISQYATRLVNKEEYEKYSKDLSRLSKAHKEKEKQEKKEREREDEHRESRSSSKRDEGKKNSHDGSKAGRPTDDDRHGKKRKHEDKDDGRKSSKQVVAASTSSKPRWLRRDLRVRFVDKFYKGGKYYNKKMTVDDVVTPEICVCRTEEGRILEGIEQSMLETIIPKTDKDYVMVVLGKYKGQVGLILNRDKNNCQATVQLTGQSDQLLKLSYDDMCHYVGEVDEFE